VGPDRRRWGRTGLAGPDRVGRVVGLCSRRRRLSYTAGMADSLRNDFPAGVLTGDSVSEVFALAKAEQFALPAANCIGTNSMNAVMETAAKVNSPVIIQFSSSGSAFVAGKGVGVSSDEASILGSVAGAKHVRTLAEAYGARVILHTDHCPKKNLGWISGLLDVGEQHFEQTGDPLFSSHMLDLSEEPMEENIDICVEYLQRMSKMGMTLEIELGITGGEEDGVDNTAADPADLYSKPEEVAYAYERLSEVSPNFTIAAAFGNVHGVYKPGHVKLRPAILKELQDAVAARAGTDMPFDLVFHGGSGSSLEEIHEALDHGVVKMNVDTDTQYAFTRPVAGHMFSNYDGVLKVDGDVGNKKVYDPRSWGAKAEDAMAARVIEACESLRSAGTAG